MDRRYDFFAYIITNRNRPSDAPNLRGSICFNSRHAVICGADGVKARKKNQKKACQTLASSIKGRFEATNALILSFKKNSKK